MLADLEDSLTNIKSDLPIREGTQYNQMVAFFDNRFNRREEFSVNEYDSIVSFFEKRQFESISAKVLAQVLLVEAKREKIPVHQLLDGLSKYSKPQLSSIILTVLNSSRDKTSQLGFLSKSTISVYEERNIPDMITNDESYNSLSFSSVSNTKNNMIAITQGGTGETLTLNNG